MGGCVQVGWLAGGSVSERGGWAHHACNNLSPPLSLPLYSTNRAAGAIDTGAGLTVPARQARGRGRDPIIHQYACRGVRNEH